MSSFLRTSGEVPLISTLIADGSEAGHHRAHRRADAGVSGPVWTRPESSRLVDAALDAAATDAATAAAADHDGGHGGTDHLGRLLATVPVIEQAKGLLIGYYGIDAASAYTLLRNWSSRSNVKLSRISEQLLAAASQPADRPFAGLQTFLESVHPTPDHRLRNPGDRRG